MDWGGDASGRPACGTKEVGSEVWGGEESNK